jgi:hypothetical protein
MELESLAAQPMFNMEMSEIRRLNMKKLHSIILLLTGVLLLAGCQSSSQIQANNRIEAMQMLKHLALGCHLYAGDNDGMLPASLTDVKPYVDKSYDPQDYVLTASGKLNKIVLPSKAILIRQKELLLDGQQAVAFADGHSEIISTR